MVEAEASVSGCCAKISYQSFCQHELFEVVGDSHDIFCYAGQKQYRRVPDVTPFSQLKEYKPEKKKPNRKY